MPQAKLTLEIQSFLPEVSDDRDACLRRVMEQVQHRSGVVRTHVLPATEGKRWRVCVHYDPDRIQGSQVESLLRSAGADISERYGHAVFDIRLVAGEDSASRVETQARAISGVVDAAVNLPAQKLRVEFDRRLTNLKAVRELLTPPVVGRGPGQDGRAGTRSDPGGPGRRLSPELLRAGGAGLCLVAAWAGGRWWALAPQFVGIAYTAAYMLGAWDLVTHWVRDLFRGRLAFDIDLLMLVAAIGAALLGEFAEGAFLLVLFSLAHALEHVALDQARGAIRALADLAPQTATVVKDGELESVPVDNVRPGDDVLVRPAERIPVDGVVVQGRSTVNQAPITGESKPIPKGPGDDVFAGTVNGEGSLTIGTERSVGDRTLDRVVELVEVAQTRKAPTERSVDRFERIFVPSALLFALAMAVVPPLIGVLTWESAWYRAMALLVASSPCALAIGTPSAILAGIAHAARNGVLIKGGLHLENLGTVEAVAMDKTGTLTVGRPEVTDVLPLPGSSEVELLTVAGTVERGSQHPLAEAVVREAEKRGLALGTAEELISIAGRGVRSSIDGLTVEIGSARLWEGDDEGIPQDALDSVSQLEEAGRSVVIVRFGSRWLGTMGVADRPRTGVVEVLGQIRALGVKSLMMVTGDNEEAARSVANAVGIDEVHAGLLPDEKVDVVRGLLSRHRGVAMIGDGVNDAPALATASVGIAMGGAGTAAALETADVALMGDDLRGIPFVIGLSRRTRAVIRQNLAISVLVVAVLILATTFGGFGIGTAVLLHEGSTLVVVGNALRIMRFSEGGRRGG